MQSRVTCPACQTSLAVNAAAGEGAVLRCPKCRHEFAIRWRAPSAPPAARSAADSLFSSPTSPYASYNQPPASWPAPDSGSGSNSTLLWIGLGAGAAMAIAAVVLVTIVMQSAGPNDNAPNAAQNLVASAAPARQPASAAPTASSPSPVASSTQDATATPSSQPSVPTAPSAAPQSTTTTGTPTARPDSQPVSSIRPGSPSTLPPSALPPSASPPVAAPPPAAALLAYRFNAGEEYAYSFSIKADIAGTADQASGMCTLVPSRETAPAEFAAHNRQGQGNGSGFVVTADGYIVTCAHVVEGSTKIDAVLGSQTYPAQVVAFDKEHDLAVVRITAANLPTLSLANSDAVEQGQDVRAVGFPLSNVLGDSVKINRGTVAGIVNTSGRKLIQIDGSVNPGNSGGPLVNEQGQVVGVASSKLAGEDIDGVGFAVPANIVLSLLRSHNISSTSAVAGAKLDGPALARRVTPAVALLKITTGSGGYGMANRLVLDFSGHVNSSGPPRVVGRMRTPGFPNIESDRGRLLVTDHGEIVESTANVQVPYLLGPVGMLIIEPLGAGEQRTWQTQRATALTQVIEDNSHNPMPFRFRHRSRNPFGGGPFGQAQPQVVVTPAIETSSYELTTTTGDLATITKRYTFETLQAAGAPPIAKATGEGTITFNRAKGHPEKMDYHATLVRSTNNVSITVPYTLEWHRLSAAELDKVHAQAKANAEEAQRAAAEHAAQEAMKNVGEDTSFVGGNGGGPKRLVEDTPMLGVECKFSEWGGQQCVNDLVPIFSRDQQRRLSGVEAVAREGYAVGAVNVYAKEFVNAIQLVFMRLRDDGRLDPADSYTSKWLGARSRGKTQKLSGDGDQIIGVHMRRGLVIDSLALVVKRAEAAGSAGAEE